MLAIPPYALSVAAETAVGNPSAAMLARAAARAAAAVAAEPIAIADACDEMASVAEVVADGTTVVVE